MTLLASFDPDRDALAEFCAKHFLNRRAGADIPPCSLLPVAPDLAMREIQFFGDVLWKEYKGRGTILGQSLGDVADGEF